MKYLHTMIRVSDVEETLRFFALLGLKELRRYDNEAGRFTLIFLAAPGDESAQIELTHNWDEKGYGGGRNFGHVAYAVDNIYESCARLMAGGVTYAVLGEVHPAVREAFDLPRRALRTGGRARPAPE